MLIRYFDDLNKVSVTFADNVTNTYTFGELLVNFIETDFDKILEVLVNYLRKILIAINKDFDLTKFMEYTNIEMFDLESIINFEYSFKFPEAKNEKYFIMFVDKIKKLINKLIKIHVYYRKYFVLFNICIKNINKDEYATRLISFLQLLIANINTDKMTAMKYKQAVEECLTIDAPNLFKGLNPFQRFCISSKRIEIECQNFTGSYKIHISEKRKKHSNITTVEPKNNLQNYDIYLSQEYADVDIEVACYLEFMRLLSNKEALVKRCGNCRRFFISDGRSDILYCNRKIKGSKNTCRDVGAKIKHSNNIDYIEKEYRKVRNKVNMAKSRGKYGNPFTEGQIYYDKWCIDAKEMKSKAKNGEITEQEFIIWLG